MPDFNFSHIEIGYRSDGDIVNSVVAVGADGSRINLPCTHVASDAPSGKYQTWTFSLYGSRVRHVDTEDV